MRSAPAHPHPHRAGTRRSPSTPPEACKRARQSADPPPMGVGRGSGPPCVARGQQMARATLGAIAPPCRACAAATHHPACKRALLALQLRLGDVADELEHHPAGLRLHAVGGLLETKIWRDASCHTSSTRVSWCASTGEGKVSTGRECSGIEVCERSRVPHTCSGGCGAHGSGRARESWQMYGRLAELAPGAGGGVPEQAQIISHNSIGTRYSSTSPLVVVKEEDTPC